MEVSEFKESLQGIYEDMAVRIELGVITMDEPEEFQQHLKEAISEKFPGTEPAQMDFFSIMTGVLNERLLREYFEGNWW